MRNLLLAAFAYAALLHSSLAAEDIGQPVSTASANGMSSPQLCSPAPGSVLFHGLLNNDRAGGQSAPMMYPAPNMLGLIAAVATHGILVESAKNAEKARIKTEADHILDPYESVISQFTVKELFQRSIETDIARAERISIEDISVAGSGVRMEANPRFTMTQDEKAIILTNDVVVRGADQGAPVLFQGSIKVVPKPVSSDDMKNYWSDNSGFNLKKQSAELLASSLSVALQLARSVVDATSTFRTFKYKEGDSRRFERGRLVTEGCERTVIQTLRGEVLVIPGECQRSP